MSGGHFDYAQYRIDDIIGSIEREIEAATCERTELVKEDKIAVKSLDVYGYIRYPYHWQDFRSMEAAEKYFDAMGYVALERGEMQSGGSMAKMKSPIEGDIVEIYSYTDEHYAPTEDGEEPYYRDWGWKTVAEFRRAVAVLKQAMVYANCIDYLLSGDDGEESFHERLKEELEKLKAEERCKKKA